MLSRLLANTRPTGSDLRIGFYLLSWISLHTSPELLDSQNNRAAILPDAFKQVWTGLSFTHNFLILKWTYLCIYWQYLVFKCNSATKFCILLLMDSFCSYLRGKKNGIQLLWRVNDINQKCCPSKQTSRQEYFFLQEVGCRVVLIWYNLYNNYNAL